MIIDYVSGSNIISLAAQRADVAYPAVRDLEAYWEGLRNGRVLPARTEINPRGMQSTLEYAFILERIAPGVARFRIAGSHLADLMGMEVRGMPLTAMFVPESRVKISEAIEAVCETPQTTTMTLKGERSIGRGPIEAQLLLCPLKSDLGDVNRILGCLQSRGKIGRQPRRFEVEEITSRPLLTSDISGQSGKTLPAAAQEIIDADADNVKINTAKPEFEEGHTAKGTPIPAGFAEARRAYLQQQKETLKVETKAARQNQNSKPTKSPFLRIITSET